MKKVDRLPRFMPGQVIDLSYKFKGLPNRLLIKTVFIKEQNNQWMYEAFLENTGEITILDETFICNNMTHKSARVYQCAEIVDLYKNGWRFCGNFDEQLAYENASKYATSKHIKNVILKHAFDNRGCLVNGKHGVWIRYNHIISNNGVIDANSDDNNDIIIIK